MPNATTLSTTAPSSGGMPGCQTSSDNAAIEMQRQITGTRL